MTSAAAREPAAAGAAPVWGLERLVRHHVTQRWPLPEGVEVIVGRDPAAADVVLPEPMVSRAHVAVRVTNGALWLEDAGSMNGTYGADHRRLPAGERVEHPIGAPFHLAHAGVMLRVVDVGPHEAAR